jgi:predicted enzyme related to lactoylglutathione lyase
VQSADATAERATQLGGKVLAAPLDVFDAGRMAQPAGSRWREFLGLASEEEIYERESRASTGGSAGPT